MTVESTAGEKPKETREESKDEPGSTGDIGTGSNGTNGNGASGVKPISIGDVEKLIDKKRAEDRQIQNAEFAKIRRRQKAAFDEDSEDGKDKSSGTNGHAGLTLEQIEKYFDEREAKKEAAQSAKELEKLKSEFTDDQLAEVEDAIGGPASVGVLRLALKQRTNQNGNGHRGREAPRTGAARGQGPPQRNGIARPTSIAELVKLSPAEQAKVLADPDFDPMELPRK